MFIRLAEWLNKSGRQPEQVQDFYPTPGTLSTCMYYTGIDPRTMQPVYVPKDPHEKAMQRALMQWKRPEKRPLVREALHRARREDLIGYGKGCLLRPGKPAGRESRRRGTPRQGEAGRRTGGLQREAGLRPGQGCGKAPPAPGQKGGLGGGQAQEKRQAQEGKGPAVIRRTAGPRPITRPGPDLQPKGRGVCCLHIALASHM